MWITIGFAPQVHAATPTASSVGVFSGSTTGGDSITIAGGNFTNITSVKFGNNDASYVVNSTTSITATTPAALSAGVVDVTITNNLGETGILYGSFVYTDASHNINRWIGGTSGSTTAWATGTNWSLGAAPVSSDIVYINGGTYQPTFTMTGPTTFYGMTVGPSSSSTLTIGGGSLTNVLAFAADTTIGKTGRISQTGNTTTQTHSIVWDVAGKMTVASGGTIGVNAAGYSNGNGPGGATTSSGCSHAANGGNGKVAYGSIKQPTDMGSGCGGTAGGGFIKLSAASLQLDGSLTSTASSYASAGSIWVNVSGQMTGISTGRMDVGSVSGSAGRIAVYAGSSTFLGKYFADSSNGGGAGTTYTNFSSQANGVLTINNGLRIAGQSTPEMVSGAVTYDDFHIDSGGIYEIPAVTTLSLGNLPASSTSTYPGGIIVKGGFTVPDSTTLTNLNLVLADGTYSDQNPVIGGASSIELRRSDPNSVWNVQTLTINSGGILTHTANSTTDTYAVNVNASGSITINSGGSINVTRKGYAINNGPGKGSGGIGAGHGGLGYGANATYGNAYGSIIEPFESGSGGTNVGTGGGRVKVTTSSFVNNGSVTAAGHDSGQTSAAGGAGGSIWIDAATISGTGSLDVTGGNSRGAGGGRIALYYDTNTMSGSVNMHSTDAAYRGGAGTYYKKVHSHTYGSLNIHGLAGNGKYGATPLIDSLSHYESLYVSNGAFLQINATQTLTLDGLQDSASSTSPGYIQNDGQLNVPDATPLVNYYVTDNGTYSDQNPVIGSGATYELQKTNTTTSWNIATLTVLNGGIVTHYANTTAETYALNIVAANDITIDTGGSINVVGKGYSCSNGPGAGGPAVMGYGNGGSYGGAGGRTDTSIPVVIYGSATQPTNSGSGGSCTTGTGGGGSGGGVALLTSSNGNIIVNGSVNAAGGTGTSVPYGTGGSGGSIWLQAKTVTGAGTISAKGGDPYSASGAAGGGGRVAMTYSNNLQVTSATPNKGTIAGGDQVILTGDGFSPSTLVSFGANSASISYTSSTSITATAPAAVSDGFVDVTAKNKYFDGTVTSSGGAATTYAGTAGSIDPQDTYQVATLTNGYEYGALTPQIASVSPNYGEPVGGNTVTVTGQNFMTNPTVTFGGIAATSVTFDSATQLTVVVPAHAAGTVDVSVTNSDGGTVTSPNAYIYSAAPTVSSVSPSIGATAGGDSVVISGTNFSTGMTVQFGGIEATNVILVNDTTLTATTPASARGQVDVKVANSLTQSATLSNGYQYQSPAPTVSSFTPMEGTMAGGTTVIFTGTNFDSTMKAYFDGQAATTVSATSTTLRVTTPAGQIGNATVTISGPNTAELTVDTPYIYVPAAYVFTTFPGSLHQTEAGHITLEAHDTDGQPVIVTQDTTVSLTATSATTQFSMSSTSGWGVISATIPAGSDRVDFYVKDTVKGNISITATGPDDISVSSPLTITSRYKFLITGISDPIAAGIPSSVTIQTIDWQGNPLNDYTGTVHFTSTDVFAKLPGDFQFTSDMQGNHTFVNGVTLLTSGERSVTATDTSDAAITGSQDAITVENGYSGPAAKLAVITDAQTVASNKSTSAITVQVQDIDGNPALVPVDTQIYISTSSSTGAFRADEADAWSPGTNFTVTIPAGATAVSVYYKDTTEGQMTLSFRDQAAVTDSALTDTSQIVSVGAGMPYRLSASTASPQFSSKWNPVTITLRDDQDRQLTIGQNPPTVYVTSTGTGVLFASDSNGTGASATYAQAMVTGSNKLTIYVRSSSQQQVTISVSDSQPADGATGLVDDEKLVDFVAQAATHIGLSSNASVAVGDVTTVTLTARNTNGDVAPVSTDATITLSSTGSGVFSLTASPWSDVQSLVMPAGTSTVTVYYRNHTAGTATIHSDSSLGQDNIEIVVSPGQYGALAISGPQNVPVDTPTQYAVSLRDIFGNETTSQSDVTAYLYTASGTGIFSATAGGGTISSTTIPAGISSRAVYYTDTTLGANTTLTAGDQTPLDSPDSGMVNGTLAITTVGQTIDRFVVTTPQRSIVAGNVSGAITVQAQTSDGQPARVGSNTALTLVSSSTGQPQFFSDGSGANQVTSITIPAGESQASYYYSDTLSGTFTLTALHSSGRQAAQQIAVTPAPATDNGKLIFTTPPQTKEAGAVSDAIRIATADKYGNEAVVPSDTIVTLGSDCGGNFSMSLSSWSDITTITIASGQSAAVVYFKSDISCQIQTSANGFTGAQQAYTIQNGPYKLVLTGPASLELNQVGQYTVSLMDINGNTIASNVSRVVYVSGSGLQPETTSFVLLAGQTSHTLSARATSVQQASLSARDESDITAPDTALVNDSMSTTIVAGTPTQLGIVSLTASASSDSLTHLAVKLLNSSGGEVVAPSDVTVSLSSTNGTAAFYASDANGAPAISEVVLPQNQSSVDVYYRQTTTGQAVITGQATSYASGTLSLVTKSGAIASYHLTASKDTIELGETVVYTVTGYDINGNVIEWQNGDVFYVDYTGGSISSNRFDGATHAFMVSGTATAVSFGLTANTVGTHTITISDSYPLAQPDTGITDTAHALTIIKGTPAKLAFSNPERTLERGGVSDVITVELQNSHSAATTSDTDTAVTMQTSSPTGKFATSTGGLWDATSFMIPAGSSTVALYYSDTSKPASWQIQATSPGLTVAAQNVTVIGGVPASLRFVNAPTALVSYHDSASFQVELLNRFGYQTNKQNNDQLVLSTDAPNGEFADSKRNWQTNVITWPASTSANASPSMYYRSYTLGDNTLKAVLPGITPVEQVVNILPQTVSYFVVTNVSDPVPIATPSSMVVIAKDAGGYTVPGYDGTITFSASDPETTLPSPYTFVPVQDRGTHTFVNGVMFVSSGEKTVTAIDRVRGVSGSQSAITVLGTTTGNPVTPVTPIGPTGNDDTPPSNEDDEIVTGGTDESLTPTPRTNADSSNGSVSSTLSDLAQPLLTALGSVKGLLYSKNAPYAAPTAVFSVFFGYTLLFAAAGIREKKSAQILAAVLKKEKAAAHEKNEFIMLLSHHLRTPVTIISGMIDLITFKQNDVNVSELKAETAHIQRDIDAVLDTANSEVAGIQFSERPARSVYRTARFWVPLAIAIVGTLVINIVINTRPGAAIHVTAYVYQLAIGVVSAAVLYLVLRTRTLRKAEVAEVKREISMRTELDQAKNDSLDQLAHTIDTDLARFELALAEKQTSIAMRADKIRDAEQQLASISRTAKIISDVRTVVETPVLVPFAQFVETYLSRANIPAGRLAYKATLSSQTNVAIDPKLLTYVFESIIDNALKYAPANTPIAVAVGETTSSVIFRVSNRGGSLPESITKLDQPFMRAEDAESETVQGLGLSLYADKFIVKSAGGSIAISSSDGTVVTTVVLPKAS